MRNNKNILLQLLNIGIQKPLSMFRHLNLKNTRTLRHALRYESSSTIIRNFQQLLFNHQPKEKGNPQKTNIKENHLLLDMDNTFEEAHALNSDLKKSPIKTIAFYLPQFHPIPENDKWWGKGFTEWTNVTSAKPNYKGHNQPQLPLDLGFYDLRVPEVMEQQIDIAKSFGIQGFCFYKYWFDGKELLEQPLEMLLEHPEWDINFCLCWANENWTREWDGLNNHILISQNHSKEDDLAFIKNIKKYLIDPRYIKINQKPLLIIYRPQLFPDFKNTVKIWRDYCQSEGIGEIHIGMAQTFGDFDPKQYNLDFAVEFPPHNFPSIEITDEINTNKEFTGHIYNGRSIMEKYKKQISPDYILYKTVMMNWDNTARKKSDSVSFLGLNPDVFEDWFSSCCEHIIENNDEDNRLVFVNAWNEWAEGTHLEPCKKWGYAYLNRIGKVLRSFANKTQADS
ncbi:MAG: hypothetical protein GQ527_09935 [Bacteroidales bacterium]|nr:hypothetical protein [Bacteroidales bacterium]